MSDTQNRNIKVLLSEEDCDALCEMAAGYNMDASTFVTKICRDIVELGVRNKSRRISLYYLDRYLERRFHGKDNGFLTYLFANDKFESTVRKMSEFRELSVADTKAEEQALLKQLYTEYQEEIGEDADTYEVSMDKLEKAYAGRKSLDEESMGSPRKIL